MGPTFTEYAEKHRELVDKTLSEAFPRSGNPGLESFLYAPLSTFLVGGGKRTRPLMCLLACEAVGGVLEDALICACAVERFQAAALIHDDICDEGELRRGQACLHRSEGTGIALNCGDLALVSVTSSVLADTRLSDSVKLRALSELAYMMEKTCEGQSLDLGWARDRRWNLDINDYLVMATHKTAHYSAAVPLALGALIGGGTEAQIEALRSFGLDVGLAFQIQDDLLNLVGDPESQGKDFRSDITEGKRTLMVVHALSQLAESERNEFVALLSAHETRPERLARVIELMERSNSLGYCRDFAAGLVNRAKEQLADAGLVTWAYDTFTSMADFFVERCA